MRLPVLFIAVFLLGLSGKTQNRDSLRIHGNISISTDFYGMRTNDTLLRPRYPEQLTRLRASLLAEYGPHFKMPIELLLSTNTSSPLFPSDPENNFLSLSTSPLNRIYINPQYRNFSFDLGGHVPEYSPLTGSKIQVNGVGVTWQSKGFKVQFNTGLTQTAVIPDSASLEPGGYRQNFTGFSIQKAWKKYGAGLNLIRVSDELSSLEEADQLVPARQSVNTTLFLFWKPVKGVSLEGEVGGGSFVADQTTYPVKISSRQLISF